MPIRKLEKLSLLFKYFDLWYDIHFNKKKKTQWVNDGANETYVTIS